MCINDFGGVVIVRQSGSAVNWDDSIPPAAATDGLGSDLARPLIARNGAPPCRDPCGRSEARPAYRHRHLRPVYVNAGVWLRFEHEPFDYLLRIGAVLGHALSIGTIASSLVRKPIDRSQKATRLCFSTLYSMSSLSVTRSVRDDREIGCDIGTTGYARSKRGEQQTARCGTD